MALYELMWYLGYKPSDIEGCLPLSLSKVPPVARGTQWVFSIYNLTCAHETTHKVT